MTVIRGNFSFSGGSDQDPLQSAPALAQPVGAGATRVESVGLGL